MLHPPGTRADEEQNVSGSSSNQIKQWQKMAITSKNYQIGLLKMNFKLYKNLGFDYFKELRYKFRNKEKNKHNATMYIRFK